MKTLIKYVVSAEESHGNIKNLYESPLLDSQEECQKWIDENLPYGVQKCRTGTYEIVEIPSV